MHTMLRIYTGIPGAGPRCAAKRAEIEKVLRTIPGFTGFRLLATDDGMATVTICETQAGCDESVKIAAAFIREHLPDLAAKPPQVLCGESLLSFGAKPSK